MKSGYIKKEDRKTILFLADDMRLPSGIGTMTKELIIGNYYNNVRSSEFFIDEIEDITKPKERKIK